MTGAAADVFVGREAECAALAAALARGGHAIVEGRFGMGRTALLRRLQATRGAAWCMAFAEADDPPAAVCARWWCDLWGGAAPPRPFAALRAALLNAPLRDPRPHVLVLDGISRLTPPKADLVRRLAAAGRHRMVAVVEGGLSAAERLRLAAWLVPCCRVELGPLPPVEVRRFFTRVADEHRLAWDAATIRSLARSSAGYPLRMQELVRRELDRHEPAGRKPRRRDPDGRELDRHEPAGHEPIRARHEPIRGRHEATRGRRQLRPDADSEPPAP
jgi:hypothetical protein